MVQGAAVSGPASVGRSMAIAGYRPERILLREQNGVIVAVVGSARWDGEPLNEGALQSLVSCFRRDGLEMLFRLKGAFALAILDSAESEALLAVDRYGAYALCYAEINGSLVFGPTPAEVVAHPAIVTEIDPQSLFDYVYFHMIPAPATIYQKVWRLPPGQALRYRRGTIKLEPYWHYVFYEQAQQLPQAKLKETLRDTLRQAVARSVRGNEPIGAFLSGGTDSSTVVGLLSEVIDQPVRTYSIGFAADGYDETHYARITACHFGTDHHEYYVTPQDIVATVPKIARAYGQPFGNASAVPTFFCAQLAKEDGIDYLLGGDGGDELFGGNARYAKQWMFSLYERIPRILRTELIEPVIRTPQVQRLSVMAKLRHYTEQAVIPMPNRLESYNLLSRIGPEQIFPRDFLITINREAPLQHLISLYQEIAAESLINRMLGLDLRITLADNDLLKVVGMCDAAGVDVAFPMLDEAVGDFAAHLPPGLKVKRTRLRYFFKEALRDFLPDAVITKRKHGFGLPFGLWLKDYRPLHELVGDSLVSLRGRGLVQSALIDELVGPRLHEHAAYYGTLMWVLMILEQWLQEESSARLERQKVLESLSTLRARSG
jgi:asparagine synthase (glutamine-hydrolysing)